MLRFFFISYVAIKPGISVPFFGNMTFEAEVFPNKKAFTQQLNDLYGYTDSSVICVQEWDESDFLDWVVDPDKMGNDD